MVLPLEQKTGNDRQNTSGQQTIQIIQNLPDNGITTVPLEIPQSAQMTRCEIISNIPLDQTVLSASGLDGGSLSSPLIELCIEGRQVFIQTFGDFRNFYVILVLTHNKKGPLD